MIKSGEQILADIDTTLDQLILNAKAISDATLSALQTNEIEAVQKTQESLLARLIHMNELLNTEQKGGKVGRKSKRSYNFEDKVNEFGKLNEQLINEMAVHFGKNKKPRYVRKMRIQTKRSHSRSTAPVAARS